MKFGFLLVVLHLSLAIFAQDTISHHSLLVERTTNLLIGINWQGNDDEKKLDRFYEIGLAKYHYDSNELGTSATAIYLSEEIYFGSNGNVYGTKVGAWAHQIIDVGIAAVYYTNFHLGNFKLRGEAGFGYARTRAVLGYNLPTIDNKAFKRLKNHNFQISIQHTFSLHKK